MLFPLYINWRLPGTSSQRNSFPWFSREGKEEKADNHLTLRFRAITSDAGLKLTIRTKLHPERLTRDSHRKKEKEKPEHADNRRIGRDTSSLLLYGLKRLYFPVLLLPLDALAQLTLLEFSLELDWIFDLTTSSIPDLSGALTSSIIFWLYGLFSFSFYISLSRKLRSSVSSAPLAPPGLSCARVGQWLSRRFLMYGGVALLSLLPFTDYFLQSTWQTAIIVI